MWIGQHFLNAETGVDDSGWVMPAAFIGRFGSLAVVACVVLTITTLTQLSAARAGPAT